MWGLSDSGIPGVTGPEVTTYLGLKGCCELQAGMKERGELRQVEGGAELMRDQSKQGQASSVSPEGRGPAGCDGPDKRQGPGCSFPPE